MPSKSPAHAAAHTKGGYGGVPQSVGKDFAAADKGSAKSRDDHMRRKAKHMSQSEVGAEFGRSQSTVSRRLGFVPGGSAK